MRNSRQILGLTASSVLIGLVLSGCGLRGELKTPPPIWGEDLRSPEEIKANAPSKPDEDVAATGDAGSNP